MTQKTPRSPGGFADRALSAQESWELEPAALLQCRLGALFLVLALMLGGLLAVSLGIRYLMNPGSVDSIIKLSIVVHASLIPFLFASHAVVRFCRLSMVRLYAFETIAIGVVGMTIAFWVTLMPLDYRPELRALLAMAQILACRAALVPSAAWRTAAVGAVGLVPVCIATFFVFRDGPVVAGSRPAAIAVLWPVAWAVSIVGITAITSRVIYGLRRRVVDAMQLGRYRVERLIGRGGMGSVYLARHALLRRPTAVKVLEANLAGPEAIARFEREVQTTSELSHPNTVAIYDYGRTPDACFYYAMEYLDGFDLETLVAAEGPQPASRVVHILRQVCGALSEAHARGLVHRDIKPANIMLCERGRVPDFVKVVDFGLVRRHEPGDPALSVDLTVRGTPLYMAPEAAATPDKVDRMADIYSLGAVGYFLLCGKPPFSGRNPLEIVARQIGDAPIAPSMRTGRKIPAALEKLIMSCLDKNPSRRPVDCDAMQRALELLEGVAAWSPVVAGSWWRERAPLLRGPVTDPRHRPAAPVVVDLSDRRLELARTANG